MSQFRQNPISKHWVLIAPKRANRMGEFAHSAPALPQDLPEYVPGCVFCDTNLSPIEIAKFPNNKNWQVRVIPNKFEALAHTPITRHAEFYVNRSGSGDHEVIITRKHNEPPALQSVQTVQLLLDVFKRRLLDLSENKHLAYAQIFYNHGRDAGASVIHPHYQILAMPMVPSNLHDEILGCYHYFQENHECIYCAIIQEEQRQKERIIFETEDFVSIAPYASRNPFETWILPKYHSARYEEITPEQTKQLAYILKVTLGQLYIKLSDPPLNFYIHTLPFEHSKNSSYQKEAYHWHLTIFPRLTIWAGFEFSTGIPINPVSPESAAEFLR